MKRLLLLFLVIFNVSRVFSEGEIESKFYELDILKSLNLTYQESLFNTAGCVRFFYPSGNITNRGMFSGDLNENIRAYNESFSLSVSQLLPGFTTLKWSAGGEVSGVIGGSSEDSLFKYNVEPELQVSMPLIFSNKAVRYLNYYAGNYYSAARRAAFLNYNISICSSKKNYIDAVGNYLYLRELKKLSEEKNSIYMERLCDNETLFRLGKINYITMAEKNAEYSEFFKSMIEINKNLIEAESVIASLGIKNEDVDFSLEAFICAWKECFEKQELTCGGLHYSEDQEQNAVTLNVFSEIESVIPLMPYFSVSAGIKSKEVEFDFPDFTGGIWKVSFDVNLPLVKRSDSFSKHLVNLKKSEDLEKSRVIRSHLYSRKQKKTIMEMYDSYCSALQEKYFLEVKRLMDMKELLVYGNVSESDLEYQENFTNIQKLDWLFGELKRVTCMADFY